MVFFLWLSVEQERLRYTQFMTRHSHARVHAIEASQKTKYENFIYIFAFTTPLFEIPQLIDILVAQSAENVSLITWGYLAVSSLAWLIYGIMKKMKPLIISYILYVVVEFSLVAAIVMFQ